MTQTGKDKERGEGISEMPGTPAADWVGAFLCDTGAGFFPQVHGVFGTH